MLSTEPCPSARVITTDYHALRLQSASAHQSGTRLALRLLASRLTSLEKMDPSQTSNQHRIGVEGRAGTTVPGNMFSRQTFRYVFVGGMFALGLTWFASAQGWLGSAGEKMDAVSRGGSKPPTVVGKDKVDDSPSATAATKPAPQSHGGKGMSEGSKPQL